MRSLPINIISFHAAAAALTTPATATTSPRFLPVDLSAIARSASEDPEPCEAPLPSTIHDPESTISPAEWTRRGLAALKRMEGFIGGSQLSTVRYLLKTSEERDFFALKMEELATLIEGMPVTYGQDGKGDDAICYLHYFFGGYDCYITEKDAEPARDPAEAQWQAYGFARFSHMPESAGTGYICLPEIFKKNTELDFHFTPTPLREIKAKFGMETSDPSDPSDESDEPEIQTPPAKPAFTHPLDALRYHVTGAIERGEGEPITEIPATPKSTGIFGGWETLSEQIPHGVILFCKYGDFYETFSHHAQLAAPLLQVALTKRNMVPMCGFPIHAMDSYIKALTDAGHSVMLATFDAATGKATVQRTFPAPAKESDPPTTPTPQSEINNQQSAIENPIPNIDRIKEKLAKLLRLGEDSAATEGEIQNALNLATQLMARHQLTREDIDTSAADPTAKVAMGRHFAFCKGANLSTWESSLTHFVTEFIGSVSCYNAGKMQVRKNGISAEFFGGEGQPRMAQAVCFYGSDDDARCAVDLFEELRDAIATMAIARWGGWARGDGFAYAIGFTQGITNAHKTARANLLNQDEQTHALMIKSDSTALAIVSKAKNWLAETHGVRLQSKTSTRRVKLYGNSVNAMHEGRRDGSNYNVTRPSSSKKLGS